MRLANVEIGGQARLVAESGDHFIDFGAGRNDLPDDLLSFIKGGEAARAAITDAIEAAGAGAKIDRDQVSFLPPITDPPKIICLGLNYVDHAAEGGFQVPDYPTLFMRGRTSLVGHGHPIVRPSVSEQLDYEAELVAVIGARARHVAKADALSYVAGYSVFNDASVRDYQRRTPQWTMGKNFDGTGGFGPTFVTADEVPAGAKGLSIQCRLNGQVVQDANTTDMVFDVETTIALLTECLTLEPGDVLVMGTPAGVGHARKPPLWMKAGDLCEVEIEGVGLLANPIVDESRPA